MELRVFTEPQQGATYDDLLRVALHAERLGFGAFFRSDHYLAMGVDGRPGPSDAWTTLAGLARDTSTIRLGTMVTSATFRLPGPLAIQVAGVDQMSGGRVELGIGAGWYDAEHTAYGIPFPSTGERFDRLEEQLGVITGLWSTPPGEAFSFDGSHYRLADSPALPKPAQTQGHGGGPPVIVGGRGKKRTPALAATYADEFNLPFRGVAEGRDQFATVRRACEERGRDPEQLVYSAASVLCVGRDEAEFRRRAEAIGQDPDDLRASQAGGTVDEVVERVREWSKLGATRLYLQTLDLGDLDHLDLVAAEVAPHV
jgi:F420-dependent oxidoreductase-like protein